MKTEKKVTFADVAKYTGFSKTTISRYFNNRDSLTLENQEKIRKALDELGYEKNKLAKALANGQSEFIGVIVPNLYLDYYAEMLELILSSYKKYGYKFLVFPASDDEQTEHKYIDELMAYKIEGLIVLSHTVPGLELASYDIPVVAIEREANEVCSVTVDNYKGGQMAAECLLKQNCDHLIHINALFPPTSPAQGRIEGFRDTCQAAGVKPLIIQEAFGNTYTDIMDQIARILDRLEAEFSKDEVKGVFLANDTYAASFLNQLIRRYGRLPETYRLIGFDNTRASREVPVPITTIGQPKIEMVDAALDLLSRQIAGAKKRVPEKLPAPVHHELEPILIERETTHH